MEEYGEPKECVLGRLNVFEFVHELIAQHC